jgi:hypothetical protein
MRSIDQLFSDDNEWGSFHDVVCEIRKGKYTPDTLKDIFIKLPDHIKNQAQIWGINDTVVRDDAYVYLCAHPELIP